eukprot:c28415_g1_i1 orf=1255-2787(-)
MLGDCSIEPRSNFELLAGKSDHFIMKLKARKASSLVSATDQRSQVPHKRFKLREHTVPLPSRACIQTSKGSMAEQHSEEHSRHFNCDLKLAFSSMDLTSVQQKVVSTMVTWPSIIDTMFSPMVYLFKGVSGETLTSCTSSVGQVDGPDETAEVVHPTAECMFVSQEIGKDFSGHCSSATTVNVDIGNVKSICSIPRSTNDVVMSPHMSSVVSLSEEDLFSPQASFDMGVDYIGWVLGENYGMDPSLSAGQLEEELLDSNGASLCLSAQQAIPLDCSDDKESGKTEGCDDVLDDFDSYLFIKHLPDLLEVVSPFRPMLLPKQTQHCPPITLVLDLDETLVHSSLEHCVDADFTFPVNFNFQEHTVYVRRRPYLQLFMERVSQMFEIIVFTASQSVYAEQVLDVLDPKRKLIRHRVYRDSCVFVEGNYIKDLAVLGRDLAKVAIIDNSPQAFGFQLDNGIPIESWFVDPSDNALVNLLPFLESLVGVDDVRPIIASKFDLRQKIATPRYCPV